MSSIPQICQVLRTLFEEEAVLLARRAGLRQRTIPLSRLAYLFVLGWWHRPSAGPSALARFAGGVVDHMRMLARSKLYRWRKRRKQLSCMTRDAREGERFANETSETLS